MTDLTTPKHFSALELMRFSAELLEIRASLEAGNLNPIEQVRASARGLELRAMLGATSPVTPVESKTPEQIEGQAAFDRAKDFYLKHLKAQVVQSVIGPVLINGTGWKKAKHGMKADTLKARLIEHVADILMTGTAGARQDPSKERSDGFVGFYFIQKEVQVDDLLVTAGVTVGEDAKGNLFYNVSHSDRESWKAYKNGVPDSARVGPRSGNADNDMLDAAEATVADDDLNITILSVVPAPVKRSTPLDQSKYTKVATGLADEHLSERARASRAASEPKATQPEIIEYTTKRGRVLRGIVRTDLTKVEAAAIDPHTWRMNGGYFIREKYLDGDTAHLQAAPAPVVLTPEQQAEKAETDARQVEERRQKALANQVEKLRAVANKAVEVGDAGMNQDRNTNTARRAGMAASAIAKASTAKADGLTLNNIADAIEVGAAGLLSKLSSRAQLDELKRALRLAAYETDKHLSYTEQESRKGRPYSDDDIKHITLPSQLTWASRYRDAALSIAKNSPKGNSRLIAALHKMGGRSERFTLTAEDTAITRKANDVLKGTRDSHLLQYPMESIAQLDRLARMGITDASTLRDAARELLPMMVAKTEESAVKKAERAIIGQKVGIDFFPTPANVAQRMARLAGITKGTRVLEPSAGNGNLADAAKADGGEVDVIEISSQLRDILTAKGYTVVDHDFDGFTPEQPYQAILMNPPFSQRRDAAHIMRAFDMLASGGRLVAIAGEGVFFGTDQKAVAFRAWLDTHNATVEKLEGGTFKDKDLLAQTGANGRLIVLKK